jgi:hypothetical protein
VTVQVGIQDRFAFASDALSIAIRRKGDTWMTYATGFSENGYLNWENVRPEDAATTVDPTFTMDEDVARALMDQLIRHFEGSSDTRTLRQDYEHERKRRDNLEDAIMRIAGSKVSV